MKTKRINDSKRPLPTFVEVASGTTRKSNVRSNFHSGMRQPA